MFIYSMNVKLNKLFHFFYIHMHVCFSAGHYVFHDSDLPVSLIPHLALRFCFNYFFL